MPVSTTIDDRGPLSRAYRRRRGISLAALCVMVLIGCSSDHRVEKAVFDDRDQVVRMWRALGLTVFQVADGVKPAFGEPADLPKAA